MAMEGKDFDDKSIMAATRQENGANDNFRLSIKMPLSGREVTSEWVRADKRREALFSWVNTIRNEAASDIAEYNETRRAKIMAERAEQAKLALPLADSYESAVVVGPVVGVPSAFPAPIVLSPSSSLSTDPDAYIGDQLKRAMIREVEASDALARAEQEHTDATRNLEKWRKLQDALTKGLTA